MVAFFRLNAVVHLAMITRTISFRFFSHAERRFPPLKDLSKFMRLERILSNRGVGSRTEVSKLFKQGRIAVNGKIVRGGSDKYPLDVIVHIDGEPCEEAPFLAVCNKPLGVHSTLGDPWGRKSLTSFYEENSFLKLMHPVGRLDADTTGLLLWSNNGHLTHALLHPSSEVTREYEAVVAGAVDHDILSRKLREGVETTDGMFTAELTLSENLEEVATVSRRRVGDDKEKADGIALCGSDEATPPLRAIDISSSRMSSASVTQSGSLNALLDDEGKEDEERHIDNVTSESNDGPTAGPEDEGAMEEVPTSLVRLVVTEGKYRMVRRMLHNAGHSVLRLRRLRYGPVELGTLREGEVRLGTVDEKKWAKKLLKSKSS